MRTNFTEQQLRSQRMAESDEILRRCIHCGLCNAACPTFLVTGDERDSPRGRIVLVREMFERVTPAPTEVRRHLDRCVACNACETACPSDVDVSRLFAHARTHIRRTANRGTRDRAIRWFLSRIAPFPDRFRWALRSLPLARRFGPLLRTLRLDQAAAMLESVPRGAGRTATFTGPGTAATTRQRKGRVILLAGCAQQVLRPEINDATIRLLARRGIDVEVAAGAGCCGALVQDLGDEEGAREFARRNIDAWTKLIQREPVDAIIMNASGCGTTVKDYGYLLRDDAAYADRAREIAGLTRDVTEFIAEQDLGPPRRWSSIRVAYHAACSLQHGQRVTGPPRDLLHGAGFTVVPVPEGEICCGAAGGYNITQPDLADVLRERKATYIRSVRPDVVAAGNLGCIAHIAPAVSYPVCHTIELLDWAYGGPIPRGLEHLRPYMTDVPGPPPLEIEDYVRA